MESHGAYWDEKAGAKEKLLKWYPVGRLGRAKDVAYLARGRISGCVLSSVEKILQRIGVPLALPVLAP